MQILRFFRTSAFLPFGDSKNNPLIGKTEWCFSLQCSEAPTAEEVGRIEWDLRETFEPQNFSSESFLADCPIVLEVGPRPNIEPAWSTTKLEIFRAYGVSSVLRIRRSLRIGLVQKITEDQIGAFLAPLHDRMTQMRYADPDAGFAISKSPAPVRIINVMTPSWKKNLVSFGKEMGIRWDDQDLEYIRRLSQDVLRRNLTDVELFSRVGQGNSEHSRHWKFKGIWVIDGVKLPFTLMDETKSALRENPANSVLAFCDDSSAIRGAVVDTIVPSDPTTSSRFQIVSRLRHPTCTAETHNHPTMWEPYEGEQTLQGIFRDEEAIGRGGEIGIAANGQALGNLHIPGYIMPWEEDDWECPPLIATPLQIAIRGTSGAFDYGNCYGHPVTFGFFRTAGLVVSGQYRSWFKPVAYGAVGGSIDDAHLRKQKPKEGMLMVLIGGPAYRIGVGGGSGSSMMGGESDAELDFNSVQRGDPYMGNLLHRFIRATTELLDDNPAVSYHDLGAGGFGNASHEIAEGAGAYTCVSKIPCNDPTLSVLEIDANESQERNIGVFPEQSRLILEAIAEREGCPIAFVGQITNSGRFVLEDDRDGTTPIDLPLRETLAELPQKTFTDKRIAPTLKPLELPPDLTVEEALERVLRLPSVASKQWLTRKVDRSVSGLVAQQQCVGPNHLPVADFAIKADGYFGHTGTAYSLGEQPMKGLISPKAMVRMAVAEALLNMVGAKITDITHIKGSANWMLASSLPGQGAWLCDGVEAVVEFWKELGIAADGGKDSLSLAVKGRSPQGDEVNIAGPGQFVFCAYATMADIRQKVDPVLRPGDVLLYVDLGLAKNRMGGSALAQVYGQIGDESPDIDADFLLRAFTAIQSQLHNISAIHDRSDGGLITTLLEMAFAGNTGLEVQLEGNSPALHALFSEEAGLVIGCHHEAIYSVQRALLSHGVPVNLIGIAILPEMGTNIRYNGEYQISEPMPVLRDVWEETSYRLDRLRREPECVREEQEETAYLAVPPPYSLTFTPRETAPAVLNSPNKPKLAVWRERGSNGDREMVAACMMAGFDVWDVHTSDLIAGRTSLDDFQMLTACGGFSFADVGDAAKGWAGVCRFNSTITDQLKRFRERRDTLSFWVCNGEQLAPLIGWVPWQDLPDEERPRFIRNRSGEFESRFPAVMVMPNSKAVMLRRMEGSILGVWVAHGEGRLHLNRGLLEDTINEGLAPLCYVDPRDGRPTEVYPFNPNGSPAGVAGLCSPCGRHLAMMPHPERTFLKWQWPWMPDEWKSLEASPWLRIFQNAHEWCMKRR